MRNLFRSFPLWLRIYMLACVLTAIVIVCLSFRLIAIASESGLQREIGSTLDKHRMFGDSLSLYASTLNSTIGEDSVQAFLPNAVRNYVRYYTDPGSFVSMSDEEERTMYSNMSADMKSAMELRPAKDGERSYVIRRSGPQTVLFVSGWLLIGGHHYRLDYAHDMTDLVQAQQAFGNEAAVWLAVGLLTLAVLLYTLLKRAFCPLHQLSMQAQAIAQGKQTQPIAISSSDEIGRLAADFNQMAEAIQAQTELLRHSIADRETFIASLAHEVKTPLTAIMGYASLLRSCNLNEQDTAKALSFIVLESKRLDDLARSLLELFRIGNAQLNSKEKVHIPSLVEELRAICTQLLSAKGQTLMADHSVDLLYADRGLLLVLLSNLVENASKASVCGTAIELAIYGEDAFVVFRLADKGSGIAEADLPRIFEPFYTVDPARDKKASGHGIGLSLCKAVADAHNGTIRVESLVGEGTTVFVRIPAGVLTT